MHQLIGGLLDEGDEGDDFEVTGGIETDHSRG